MTPYIVGVVLAGLIASLLSPGTLIEIEYALHYGMPSMYNTEWNGTSILASTLTRRGYHVVEAYTIVDPIILAEAYNPKRIIYVYIAPLRPLDMRDVDLVEELMDKYSVSLLVCDEANTSNVLLSRYGLHISGRILYTSYGSPYPLAYFKVGDYNGLFILNYASSVGYTGRVEVVAKTPEGDIVGVVSEHSDDMVMVIADSSLFINLMLSKSTYYMNYTKLVEEIFNYLSRNAKPEETLIIIDLTHYQTPSPRKIAEVTGKGYAVLHPLIIAQLLSTYALYVEEVLGRNWIENMVVILIYTLTILIAFLVLYNLLKP